MNSLSIESINLKMYEIKIENKTINTKDLAKNKQELSFDDDFEIIDKNEFEADMKYYNTTKQIEKKI